MSQVYGPKQFHIFPNRKIYRPFPCSSIKKQIGFIPLTLLYGNEIVLFLFTFFLALLYAMHE